jgi:serine/threonine protein kinase
VTFSSEPQQDRRLSRARIIRQHMSLKPGLPLGLYEVLSLIGAGGMGEVYQARDTRLDRKVAVKVLAPELASDADFRARFEREAKAISALNHPHICALYDIGPERDRGWSRALRRRESRL